MMLPMICMMEKLWSRMSCWMAVFVLLQILFSSDGLPAYEPMTCEYFDPLKCSHCNSTMECEKPDDGKRSHCYAFFANASGVLTLSKKGCWLNDGECYDRTNCTAKDDGNGNFYCCCEGSMCNVNVTISAYRPTPSPPSRVIPQHDPAVLKTLLCSLVPLLGITVVVILLFLLWRCRRQDYFDQFEATGDKPLLPVSPPSPLPSVSLRNITLLEVKARGCFGLVYKAKMGNEHVAVKSFPLRDQHSWSVEFDFYRKPFINNHENILRFIAAEKRENELWLITEFHQRGSLYDHLKANTINLSEALRIIVSMTRGLVFLHSTWPAKDSLPGKPSIVHRDLKSRNILLKDDMTACLADFGLALVLDVTMDSLPGQVGTRRYMSPEVLDGSIIYSPMFMLKVDIYAFALILWEIVSRCTAAGSGMLKEYMMPFQEEVGEHPSIEDMQEAVVQKKTRPVLNRAWYQNITLQEICQTIEDCWDQDPEARLTMECIYERFNHTSNYILSLDNVSSVSPLPSQGKDQSSTSSSSLDDSSSIA